MVKLYPAFLLMATAAICSPGPGVVLTLTNSLQYGAKGALGGIVGVACGTLVVAGVAATSIGALLATSAAAFTAIKLIGAVYLAWLGVKLWRAPGLRVALRRPDDASFVKRIASGVSLQVTNPKAILFFLSVFPQFIDMSSRYLVQFSVLVGTYCMLLLVIHGAYALVARQAQAWLSSGNGGRILNRTGAVTFLLFAMALGTAKP
ncbi:LysE family translocator [Oxalobacteraceae bacterium OM1]|nr:LysE family translocator [Oxalobacteraceae bacterium OM1]